MGHTWAIFNQKLQFKLIIQSYSQVNVTFFFTAIDVIIKLFRIISVHLKKQKESNINNKHQLTLSQS